MTVEMVAFLRDRYDEVHEVADREHQHWTGSHWDDVAGEADSMLVGMFSPSVVLADVDAKRRIVDACEQASREASGLQSVTEFGGRFSTEMFAIGVLRLLVQQFADHSDFKPAWTVEVPATS